MPVVSVLNSVVLTKPYLSDAKPDENPMSLNPAKYQFLLQPWEYPSAEFNPHPDAVSTLEIQGRERIFLLKVREGRVYFRRPESRPIVWALTRLLPEPGVDLVRFWKDQVERGHFGIYRVVTRGYDATFTDDEVRDIFGGPLHRSFESCPMNLLQTTPVSVIVCRDGSGWVREWCARQWLPMVPVPGLIGPEPDDIWKPIHYLGRLRKHLRVMAKPLALRPMEAAEWEPNRVRWVQGSRAELKRLIHLWHVAAHVERPYPARVTMAAGLPFAVDHMEAWRQHPWTHWEFPYRHHRGERPEFSGEILAAILSWHKTVGIQWQGNPAGFRCSAGFRPRLTSYTLDPAPAATALARSEARTEIWRWMEGKFPRRMIQRLRSQPPAYHAGPPG
jgi:hypothetical protein